jgi:hypothetical protein
VLNLHRALVLSLSSSVSSCSLVLHLSSPHSFPSSASRSRAASHLFSSRCFSAREGLVVHTSVRTVRPAPPLLAGSPRPPCSILPVTSSRSPGSLLRAFPCCEAPLPSASASASSPLPVVVVRRQESHAWQPTRP